MKNTSIFGRAALLMAAAMLLVGGLCSCETTAQERGDDRLDRHIERGDNRFDNHLDRMSKIEDAHVSRRQKMSERADARADKRWDAITN